ncbi:MAG: hypothetical protein ACLFQR_05135 [Desulfovibrionales bacterium]
MPPELLQGLEHAARLCFRVLPLMLAGCLAGSVFVHSRFGVHCGRLFEPLSRWAGLGPRGAMYLALCLLNQVAANAYLSTLLRERHVEDRRLLGTYLVGWLPASSHYYVFYFAPVLLPGLGLKTGCTVLGLYLLGSLLICTCGLLLLRFQGAASHSNVFPDMAAVPLPSWPGWQTALTSGIKQFVRIAGIFVPCMLVIAMLLNLPLTRTTIEDLGGVLTQVGLAESSVVVVITALPSMMSGFATAIASIQQGVLSHQQIVPLIFLSAIGHALFSAFSHFLPTNMAIFGPQCGASLTFASLSIRLTCLVVVLSLALVL